MRLKLAEPTESRVVVAFHDAALKISAFAISHTSAFVRKKQVQKHGI
jgi:hypothetical protein